MEFQQPIAIYTAATNVEAHIIVTMLESKGIPAFAVEDQSAVSLWMFGTISQFHRPKIWVEKSTAEEASRWILEFEASQRQQRNPAMGNGEIQAVCEECGATTTFPISLNGSTQQCAACLAYLDVGETEWEADEHEESE